jgi:hypothetical protein
MPRSFGYYEEEGDSEREGQRGEKKERNRGEKEREGRGEEGRETTNCLLLSHAFLSK